MTDRLIDFMSPAQRILVEGPDRHGTEKWQQACDELGLSQPSRRWNFLAWASWGLIPRLRRWETRIQIGIAAERRQHEDFCNKLDDWFTLMVIVALVGVPLLVWLC